MHPCLCPAPDLRRWITIQSGGWKQHTPRTRRPICLVLKRRTPTWGYHSWSSSWRKSGWNHQRTPWTSDLPPTTQSEATAWLPNFLFEDCPPQCRRDFPLKTVLFKSALCWWEPRYYHPRNHFSSRDFFTRTGRQLVPSGKVTTGYYGNASGFLWGNSATNWLKHFFFFLSLLGRWIRQMFWECLIKVYHTVIYNFVRSSWFYILHDFASFKQFPSHVTLTRNKNKLWFLLKGNGF